MRAKAQDSNESTLPFQQCAVSGCRDWGDRHHIKTRGAGGSDDPENIIYLCRVHHAELHAIGTEKFLARRRLSESDQERLRKRY